MSNPNPDRLSIAELAERVGLTRRTIRYYVAEGLLPAPGGRGQRRVYTPDHLARLQVILRLKAAFLPLSEIRRRLLELTTPDLRRLADDLSEPATDDAADAIVSYLAAGARPRRFPIDPPLSSLGSFLASRGASIGARPLEGLRQPGVIAPQPESLSAPGTGPDDASGSVWRRVTLAPGVELQYQVTGDLARDLALDRFIQSAKGVLASLPPPDDSHRSS